MTLDGVVNLHLLGFPVNMHHKTAVKLLFYLYPGQTQSQEKVCQSWAQFVTSVRYLALSVVATEETGGTKKPLSAGGSTRTALVCVERS